MAGAEFWRGRRVLVTGLTGFKGAWLGAKLHELGAEVTGLALPAEPGSLHEALGLAGVQPSRLVDVRAADAVAAVVERAHPEIVFHLAAQPLVPAALRAPAATFAVNVMGTVNVLEAIRAVGGVRAAIVVTSDKCYRDPAVARAEGDALGGLEPYGASKACAEHVVEAWRACFLRPADGIGLASARAGNVIGGGDFGAGRLLPELVEAFLDGRPALLRAPGAIRPWQHVLDAVAGYLLLAEALWREPAAHAAPWNFGPLERDDWRVADVAAAVASATGGGTWRQAPGGAPAETPVLRLSAERARQQLGWRPRLSTRDAIAWTVEGYRRLREGDVTWVRQQLRRHARAPVTGVPEALRACA